MNHPSLLHRRALTVLSLAISVLAFAAVSILFVRAEDKLKAVPPSVDPVVSQEAKAVEDGLRLLEGELNGLSRFAPDSPANPANNDSLSASEYALSQLRQRLSFLKNWVERLKLEPETALRLRNHANILEGTINQRKLRKRRAGVPVNTIGKGSQKLNPLSTGAISGVITDSATLLPIANVNLEISNSTGAFITGTTTDGSGNYTSPTVLATGNYFVRTTNNLGYVNEVYDNITCVSCNPTTGTPVAVTDGSTTSGINFALAAGGRISGTVTNASTAAALVGVNVQIFDSGGAFVANGFTDGLGNYISDGGLPAGSYFARTNNGQGFIDKLYNNITCAPCNPTSGTAITVTGTATTSGINFALNAGGRISGNVTDASSAAAIANVNVDIFNSTGSFVTGGFTDGSGNYTTGSGLLPGSYYARTNNSAGYVNKLYNNITCVTCNPTSGTSISVSAGTTTSGINFSLNAGGRIAGTVTDSATSAPLAGVDVQILNSSGAYVTSGFTDSSGSYTSSSGLLPGNHFVLTNNSLGYIDEVYNDITCAPCNPTSGSAVSVTAGTTTLGISFALAAGGRIAGTVTSSATSAPLTNVSVQILNASGFQVSDGFTDGSGNYISPKGLTAGTYYARTSNSLGYIDEVYNNLTCLKCNVTGGTPITVTAGMTTSGINFALATGGRISGNVTDGTTAAPVAGINVNIFDAMGQFVSSGLTDGLGNYITDGGLPSGNYFALTNNFAGYVNKLYNNITCVTCNPTSGTAITVTAGSTTSGISFSLNVGGRISGTVTDAATAAPIANVNMQIVNSTGAFVSSGFTDSAGQYLSSAGLTTGTYFVKTQNSQGYVNEVYNNIVCAPCNPTSGTAVSVTAGATTSGISFSLNAGGRISGAVTDAATSAPLANTNVQLFNSTGAFIASAFTDGSGNYLTAEGLLAGTYYALTNSPFGYINELYNNITCVANCNVTSGTPITVTAGATTSGISFALAAGGSISGTVTDSATMAGISGVNVSIFDSAGFQVAFGATDGAGNYNTNVGLPSGTYYARTNNSLGYINELYNNITCVQCNLTTGTPITVTAGSTTAGIDFALSLGGRISGTVIDAATMLPLGGLRVDIYDVNGFFLIGYNTDGSGNYLPGDGLPAGTYFARTSNGLGYIDKLYNNITCAPCNPTSGTAITLTAGATTSGISFALALGGRISGSVTDSATSLPLANVSVEIFNSTGAFVTSGFTDSSGNYTTGGGLPTGNYFARTRNSLGYIEELYNNIACLNCNVTTGTPIPVTSGSTTTGINITLVTGGRISGTVIDAATSAPVLNSSVQVFNSAGVHVGSGFTDNTGMYTSPAFPAGTYYARTNNSSGYLNKLYNNLDCSLGCNPTTGTPITVTAGTTTPVNFALAPGGRLAGTVIDTVTALPIANVNISIVNSSGTAVAGGVTDGSGNYISDTGLPAGNYFVRTNNSLGYVDKVYNNITCAPCNVTTGTPVSVTVGATTSGINFALAVGGQISGTVTDSATAAPLVNVNVQVFNSTGSQVTSVNTDSSGSYTILTGLLAGNYFVRSNNSLGYVDEVYNNITCAPCSVTTGTPVSVTVGATTSGINFALAVGGQISGTVTDSATAAPLVNVNVQVFNSTGSQVTSVNTNSSGSYTILTGLLPGNYFVRTNNSVGYVNELYDNITCAPCNVTTGSPVAVSAGAITPGISFALAAGGRISGTVTDAGTTAPIANINVQVFNSTGASVTSVNTNALGEYTILTGLPAGNYFVRTNNSVGYIDEVYNDITCAPCNVTTGSPVAVSVSATTSGISFALTVGGQISGTLTDASTAAPLVNVNVQLFNSTGAQVTTVNTNALGVYNILTGLPAGSYFVRTNNSLGYVNELYNNISCAPCNVTSGTPITVSSGVTTTGIDFALAAGGRISGTVIDEATSLALANVQVQIRNTSGAVVANANTNASGTYTLGPGLPAGTYFARTTNHPGYVSEIYNNIDCMTCNQTSGTPIAVTAGVTTTGIDFTLAAGGRISGTVTDDATSAPLQDISVEIYNSAGAFVFSVGTDSAGNYLTGLGLLAGNYFVRTSSESGYINELYNNISCAGCGVTSGTPVVVTLGAITSGINFGLAAGGLISGTITDAATSAPIANADVEIYNSCGQFITAGTTDTSGNYVTVDGLPTGSYFASTFRTPNHVTKVYNNITCLLCDVTMGTPIAVTAGATTSGIDFALDQGGTITGTVTDAATGGGLLSVGANIVDSSGRFVTFGNTNIEGKFTTVTALPTGTYFASTANGHGYINEIYDDITCLGCSATVGTPINLTAGTTTSGINFALTLGGRIYGTLTNASTSAPLQNSLVQVYDSAGTLVTTVGTDSSGNYISRGGLPTGNYFVRTANSQGLIDEVFDNIECAGCVATTGTPVAVTLGSTANGINFALNAGGRISGAVTNAATSNPLIAIPVQIYNASGALVTTSLTDCSGIYTSLSGLPTGTYYARTANTQGFGDVLYNNLSCTNCDPTTGTAIPVTSGATTSAINFALCKITLSPNSQTFSSVGEERSFGVAVPGGCSWIAATTDSWIVLTSDSLGSGNGTVSYLVRDNLAPTPRTGTITIGGQIFSILQGGTGSATCTYSISPLFAFLTVSGGTGVISVTAPSGCVWAATSNVSWITITSGSAAIGNGQVNYVVAPNSSGGSRKATITVAGQKFNVKQNGS